MVSTCSYKIEGRKSLTLSSRTASNDPGGEPPLGGLSMRMRIDHSPIPTIVGEGFTCQTCALQMDQLHENVKTLPFVVS